MMKLIETGFHEQENSGQVFSMASDKCDSLPTTGQSGLTASHTEPFRQIKFLGTDIPFGPLIHTWTDLEVAEVRQLEKERIEISFKGGPKSIWRIDYKKPEGK